jgi:DNA-binding response OmpR family regulator
MTEPIQVLIVDDEEGIRTALTEILRRDGHAVTSAASGEEALERLRDTGFDVAVLDLKLGGRVDGLRVLEAVNWRWPATAKIILTAHGSLDSAMEAIREGVDAYLLKPVRAQELRQAVQQVLNRREQRAARVAEPPEEEMVVRSGGFEADLRSREVLLDGVPLDLTVCEFELLVHLMRNQRRVVPPPELVEVVREYECSHLQEARDIIKWYVYRLRRKVEPNPSRPRYILNVRGVGYTFKP